LQALIFVKIQLELMGGLIFSLDYCLNYHCFTPWATRSDSMYQSSRPWLHSGGTPDGEYMSWGDYSCYCAVGLNSKQQSVTFQLTQS